MSDLAPGDVVECVVESIAPYGLWCVAGEHSILVTLPETDVFPRESPGERYSTGERIFVRILRRNELNGKYHGSVKIAMEKR